MRCELFVEVRRDEQARLDDLIEGWLRTGPHSAWHTVVAGRLVVESGLLVAPDLDEKLAAHAAAARRFQPTD